MQFEDFDNKIRQAADQHHPDYDEKAWAKMKKLLDRHLPQKDDRRRRIVFFLLFFLLAGGGAWLIISKPWQKSNQTLTTVNTSHKIGAESSASSEKDATERVTGSNTPADKKKDKDKDKEAIAEPVIKDPVVTNEKKNIVNVEDAVNSKPKRNQNFIVTTVKANVNIYKQEKALAGKNDKADQFAVDVTGPGRIKKDKNPPGNNAIVSSPDNNNYKVPGNDNTPTPTDQPAANDVSKNKTIEAKKDNVTDEPNITDKKDIAKKSSSKKSNSLFFSFSTGPDISSIGLDKPGKVKFLAGAGLGYTFKDRWTLRTGFYSGRKIYSAKKEEYKPTVPPLNYNYLDKIDADCKVYEIPVSLVYNFSQSKKHSLFAAVGLSSYIMKKETYVYLYKYPNGQTYPYTKILSNGSKHYFSVLTLSGGYQRKINKTFSIGAEPYIKLPLAGIGFGKMKLNSAGILFSVGITPF